MLDLGTLNPPQKLAVTSHCGPLMILAGAGTGKTRVISYRVAHMIFEGIDPSSIVALTFTNKAAKEMSERIRELVGSRSKNLSVGTFHSFCLRQLRLYPQKIGLNSGFSLAGSGDQLDIVRRVLEELGYTKLYRAEDLLTRISQAKNHILSPKDIDRISQVDSDAHLLSRIYSRYERHLRLNNSIDFDDCIYKFIRLCQENKAVREKIESQFKYFLVDEFQDTNLCQLEALLQMAEKSQNVCVVGDDDQSIYSWRGADPSILEKFEARFCSTKLIKLEQNYRCTKTILDAANNVIKNNSNRKEKTLWSHTEGDSKIRIKSEKDDQHEARWIAKKCYSMLGNGTPLKEIGILYRANSQARAIEVALREMRLKYKIYGGSSFFEKKEVRDFLSYFRLVLVDNDHLAFWRVINTPTRGIGLKTQESIAEISKDKKISPSKALELILPSLGSNTQKSATHFLDTLKEMRKVPLETAKNIEDLGLKIIKHFGLEDDIRSKSTQQASRERKLDSIRKLPSWLNQLSSEYEKEYGSINAHGLIDQLFLSSEPKSEAKNEDLDAISLMTIHSAKGLEFPIVFLCGVEEDQIPHKNSQTIEQIAEERRLFYVAITRAKKNLYMSMARQRYASFQSSTRRPSRFLQEIPEELLIRNEKEESPEDRKQNNISKLGQLRQQLKATTRSQ